MIVDLFFLGGAVDGFWIWAQFYAMEGSIISANQQMN